MKSPRVACAQNILTVQKRPYSTKGHSRATEQKVTAVLLTSGPFTVADLRVLAYPPLKLPGSIRGIQSARTRALCIPRNFLGPAPRPLDQPGRPPASHRWLLVFMSCWGLSVVLVSGCRRLRPAWAGQGKYDVRFQWGPVVAPALGDGVCVVVDVLCFTTTVGAAVSRGVAVYPYRWRDATTVAFADSVHALLADGRDPAGPSLSPLSMDALTPGSSVVIPSPNGSTCAVLAAEAGAQVVAGCLRNAAAVGAWAGETGGPVTVIACGERWPDGSLRPSRWRTCSGPGRSSPRRRATRRPKRGRRLPPSVLRRTACPRSAAAVRQDLALLRCNDVIKVWEVVKPWMNTRGSW